MKVILRNPRREVELAGPLLVERVLDRLGVLHESVLVIRGDELLTRDIRVEDGDTIELRPVISGGAADPGARR
jgi:sulfur carrier protein